MLVRNEACEVVGEIDVGTLSALCLPIRMVVHPDRRLEPCCMVRPDQMDALRAVRGFRETGAPTLRGHGPVASRVMRLRDGTAKHVKALCRVDALNGRVWGRTYPGLLGFTMFVVKQCDDMIDPDLSSGMAAARI